MTVMQPSKGGSGLAQSFLTNTATQVPQQSLPQIQAPQSLLPMGPMPMPTPQGPFFADKYMNPSASPAPAAGNLRNTFALNVGPSTQMVSREDAQRRGLISPETHR